MEAKTGIEQDVSPPCQVRAVERPSGEGGNRQHFGEDLFRPTMTDHGWYLGQNFTGESPVPLGAPHTPLSPEGAPW
jgi:hypothetical protein